jgi:uncharacterized protein YoxC
MNAFIDIAIGLVVIAVLAMSVAVIRALGHFSRTLDGLTAPDGTLSKLVEDLTRTSAEVRELVAKLERIAESLEEPASQFASLGSRAASVSSAVLDEVERPLLTAVALVRGVRAGAGVLVDRWAKGQANGAPTAHETPPA